MDVCRLVIYKICDWFFFKIRCEKIPLFGRKRKLDKTYVLIVNVRIFSLYLSGQFIRIFIIRVVQNVVQVKTRLC